MTVNSDDYVLAIPDYSHQARENSVAFGRDGESSSTSSKRDITIFKKVIMKLSGNVQWLAGLVFERDLDQGGRSFEFMPHYDVTLRTPEHTKAPLGRVRGSLSELIPGANIDTGLRRFQRVPQQSHPLVCRRCSAA